MAKVSLVTSQRRLMGIISSVEAGVYTPEEAVVELNKLKEQAPESFKADYTVEDFRRIYTEYAAQFDSSTEFEDSTPFVSSTSY